jgi:hypothetical protein
MQLSCHARGILRDGQLLVFGFFSAYVKTDRLEISGEGMKDYGVGPIGVWGGTMYFVEKTPWAGRTLSSGERPRLLGPVEISAQPRF